MIPWVREKLAEKRAKWISRAKRNFETPDEPPSTSSSGGVLNGFIASGSNFRKNERTHIPSNPKSTASVTAKSGTSSPKQQQVAKTKVKIRIISPSGRIIALSVEQTKRLIDVKNKALIEFLEESDSLPYFATDVKQLTSKYRLIRSELGGPKLSEGLTISQLGINDGDTLVLATKRENSQLQRLTQISSYAPTNDEIEEATKDIACTQSRNKTVDINEIFHQSSLDVRKVLISLAQCSARIIGSGPYADRLISMLKQKVINKHKNAYDKLQCLVELGYSIELAAHALKISDNNFGKAFEWLITHKDYDLTKKQDGKDKIVNKTETLIEIVRIYSQRYIPPQPETIQSLVEMGFDEENILSALKATRNNKAAAAEWLCGNRSGSLVELREGLSQDSPVLQSILDLPQVQVGLSNTKMFLGGFSFLSIFFLSIYFF
ncbi:UBAC1 family protein [Megaselia abdita]